MRTIFIITLCILFAMSKPSFSQNIKEPNVSGTFYPSRKEELQTLIDSYVKKADIVPSGGGVAVVVAPHAGYIYSAPVAAHSFKFVSRQEYKTVVILAVSHYFGFDGIAVGVFDALRTPLGDAGVDKEFARRIVEKDPKFLLEPRAFGQEHSLEVEVPFVQTFFPDAKIVPVIFGQPSYQTVKYFGMALSDVVGERDDVLVVVSSDLSHYHDYNTAQKLDREVMDIILSLDAESLWQKNTSGELEMCGFMPAVAGVIYARERGFSEVRVLKYANSGDVTGDRERVVGYGAMAILGDGLKQKAGKHEAVEVSEDAESRGDLTGRQKKRLLEIARQTMEKYVREKQALEVSESDPRMHWEEGAFVTIKKHGVLRGCIGNIVGKGPLYRTVRDMAISSCSQDRRFPPVVVDELPEIDVEISVLSKPYAAKADDIVMGKHGVIVSRGSQGGVFLPQVATETGWSKEEFLSQLCWQKAGLPPDCWKRPGTKLEIFTADVFGEKDSD